MQSHPNPYRPEPGARFLERRGEAPYLLIFETKQYDRIIPPQVSKVRVAGETQGDHRSSAFIHPSSLNGALLEVIEVSWGDNTWPAAGPNSRQLKRHPLTSKLPQVAALVLDLDRAVQR